MVSEIFLKLHVRCSIRGFQMFRKDPDGRSGGVELLARNCITSRKVNLQSKIEAIGVEVELSGNVHRCIATYLLPTAVLEEKEFFKLIERPTTTIGED